MLWRGLWIVIYKTQVLALGLQSERCSRVELNGASSPGTWGWLPKDLQTQQIKTTVTPNAISNQRILHGNMRTLCLEPLDGLQIDIN